MNEINQDLVHHFSTHTNINNNDKSNSLNTTNNECIERSACNSAVYDYTKPIHNLGSSKANRKQKFKDGRDRSLLQKYMKMKSRRYHRNKKSVVIVMSKSKDGVSSTTKSTKNDGGIRQR